MIKPQGFDKAMGNDRKGGRVFLTTLDMSDPKAPTTPKELGRADTDEEARELLRREVEETDDQGGA